MKETILNRLSDEEFLALANQANSVSDLCIKIGYNTKNTIKIVRVRLMKLGFDFLKLKGRNLSILNDELKLKKIVSEQYTYAAVLKEFNLSIAGGNMKSLKKYIKLFEISTDHFNEKISFLTSEYFNKKWDNEKIFCENSPALTQTVKSRIIKQNLFEYKCSCGLKGLWNNKPITLQLEHKNGNNTDHRLENLEFLCPNCHSQTATYGSKNNKNNRIKKIRISFIIPSIETDINNLINRISEYRYLDDILEIYKVKKCKVNREKLINMLSELNDKNVNLFLNNVKKNESKRINFPAPEIVLDMVNKVNYVKVAEALNCSDNSVRNYLRLNKLI